jgi:hypothetical protein
MNFLVMRNHLHYKKATSPSSTSPSSAAPSSADANVPLASKGMINNITPTSIPAPQVQLGHGLRSQPMSALAEQQAALTSPLPAADAALLVRLRRFFDTAEITTIINDPISSQYDALMPTQYPP